LRPAYRLSFGSTRIDSIGDPGASTVTALTVELDLDTPVDQATVSLAQVGGVVPALGVDVVVELGDADEGLTKVFTGTVTDVVPDITTHRVVAHGPMRALVGLSVDEMYLQRTAGSIVRDLCDRADLATGVVEDGVRFPAYVADGARDAYRHVRALAEASGFDAYADPDGRLVFRRFGGAVTFHLYEYGAHIIEAATRAQPPWTTGVTVYGESPVDAVGDEAVGWLTKRFTPGTAGAATATTRVVNAALRTNAAAQSAADAADLRWRRRSLTGRVRGLGRAAVALGDGVRIQGAPDGRLNGEFQVRSVRHHLTKRAGFTTEVGFWSLGSDR
jgi:phage protein D